MGIHSRVRWRSNTIVDSSDESQVNEAETLVAGVQRNSDDKAQAVRAFLTKRLDSSNAINCSPVMKVSGRSWTLGRAGMQKAVELLDTVGSSMSNLSLSKDFSLGAATKGNKISILAFEVAKTILKGYRLMQSLSDVNLNFLKSTVLPSKGVKLLISEDNDELLRIFAADKREELESFLREVSRFGNLCVDSQWRHLDRYFEKYMLNRLGGELTQKMRLNAETTMEKLMTLVQHTASLLHELRAWDKADKLYNKCIQEESISSAVQRGDLANLIADINRRRQETLGDFADLRADINKRRKLVEALKKKTLWSKSFEEVVEKLAIIAHFLLLEMNEAFGTPDGSVSNKKTLGPAGIALNYATIITQIDTLATLSGSAPSSMREALYQRLPRRITSVLPVKLRSFQVDLECHQIKAEMDKTLQWLGPIARNTTIALQGFGRNEVSGQRDVLRIETLYHADKEKTEAYILQLLVCLHHLIKRARNGGVASSSNPPNHSSGLFLKDKKMLENVGGDLPKIGVSRSQNFAASQTKLSKISRLTKSSREHQSSSETKKDLLLRWPSYDPVIDFDIGWTRTSDTIDGLVSN